MIKGLTRSVMVTAAGPELKHNATARRLFKTPQKVLAQKGSLLRG